MDITLVFGYIGALLIGVVLGLVGGGGSILTVPVLVYLFGIAPVLATAYSLFIVGLSALFGAFQNMKKGLIDFKTAAIFSLPAFIAVYMTRKYLVPAIPDTIAEIGSFSLTKPIAIMLFFALIMFCLIVERDVLSCLPIKLPALTLSFHKISLWSRISR